MFRNEFRDSSGALLLEDQLLPETWKEEYEHYYYAGPAVLRKIEEMYPGEEFPPTLDYLYKLWAILSKIAQEATGDY